MLKLLLDEHVSPAVADSLRLKCPKLKVAALAKWEGGRFLGLSDGAILQEALAQQMTLVTYDQRTIPPLLKSWMESGHDHAGVIFVDNRTIPSSHLGGLVRALEKLFHVAAKEDWLNRVCFLRR